MRLVLALAAALACLALLAGCDDDGDGIVFKDPKGEVNVERGMRFTLEFSVNASVGFDWVPVVPRANGIVELKETSVDYPNEESIGDSGFKRFVYEAKRDGEQAIELRHMYRGDQKERRRITVIVRG